MSVSLSFLVNMLQLELKEVENDLSAMEILYTNRHDSSEITNYVFMENTAVLESEIRAIHKIGDLLADFKIEKGRNPQEMLDSIDNYIGQIVRERQFSRAVYDFIKIKIAKIAKYLEM